MSRRSALLEISLVYAAIQIALWTTDLPGTIATAGAFVGVFGFVLAERVSARELGLSRQGLRPSLWIVLAALGLFALIVVIGRLSGSLHGLDKEALWWRIPAYLPWGFAQQFAAQCFFFRRLEALLGKGLPAVVATAILFAGAHLPNPVLVAATVLPEILL